VSLNLIGYVRSKLYFDKFSCPILRNQTCLHLLNFGLAEQFFIWNINSCFRQEPQ